MSRLVVVSNRVANLSRATQSGGLAVGLSDALRSTGGLWFGWDGSIVSPGTRVTVKSVTDGDVTTATVPLTQEDHDQYYLGFSNRVLWPVFHYRLDLANFETEFLTGYKRVNAKFADALGPMLREDDLLWIHDYHLIPLASELRKRGHKQKMGFFLHIPFPPAEILAAIPEAKWLARSLASHNLIGFQTTTDLSNFRNNADAFRPDEGSSTFRTGVFPIGIDVDAFRDMARSKKSDEQIDFLQRRTTARTHIIGVDRLDYSKGLPDRLHAFRRLLEKYPENRKTVTLMQIASPTRSTVEAYADIRDELEGLSGAINGEFADFDWTPVRYIHHAVPRDTLAALFRGSKVGLVTPLRDGMNLVAKEYVAAQDDEDPGVLVLSKFAGAAEELTEAMLVNPYDIDEVAETLQKALRLPVEERIGRHQALFERIHANDAHRWQETFLSALASTEGVT